MSDADKGAKFERLIKAYLRIDPVFSDQFTDVWLWSEYPERGSRATPASTWSPATRTPATTSPSSASSSRPTTTVSKPMIDSFLSAWARPDSASGSSSPPPTSGTPTPRTPSRARRSRYAGSGCPTWRPRGSTGRSSRLDAPEDLTLIDKKTPRDYQRIAIDKVVAGFGEHDRGKLIMACGTGKTFTSLKLAEENVGPGGKVLFLVPSISLLSQTVREWVANADLPIRPLAVCSDAKVDRRRPTPTPSRTSRSPTSHCRPRPNVAVLDAADQGRRGRHRGHDRRLRDLPVDRRRRPGAAGAAARST